MSPRVEEHRAIGVAMSSKTQFLLIYAWNRVFVLLLAKINVYVIWIPVLHVFSPKSVFPMDIEIRMF